MLEHVSEDSIKENLIDIGCDQKQIANFMENYKRGNLKKMLSLLKLERLQILKEVHREQKKIDNLDYLVYILKKGMKQ